MMVIPPHGTIAIVAKLDETHRFGK